MRHRSLLPYAGKVDPSGDMRAAARATIANARISNVAQLQGGTSAHVVALDLSAPHIDSLRVVFRQHTSRDMKGHGSEIASKEFRLLERLYAKGFEVPRPLAVNNGPTEDGPWITMEWIDGDVAQGSEDPGPSLSAMAGFLSRLHTAPLDDFAEVELAAIEDPASVLASYLPDDELGRSLVQLIGEGLERRPNGAVLLHGDYWPGNVLFCADRLAAVIDWEDAKIGDPLVDLACARVEISCAFGVEAADRFTAEYLEQSNASGHSLDLFDLPIWDVYVSATALSMMHMWGLPAGEEETRRAATQPFYEVAAARLLGGDPDPRAHDRHTQ